jgi:hypothetical protein
VTVGRTRRVTLREAADILGISKDAVRKRINRGTLHSDVGEDGRRYVYLDAGGDAGEDARRGDQPDPDQGDHRDALIEELRTEVAAWREESRRKDHIIAGLVERLPPAIEPPEPQNRAESAEPRSAEGQVPDEPEKPAERRSWWRRWWP